MKRAYFNKGKAHYLFIGLFIVLFFFLFSIGCKKDKSSDNPTIDTSAISLEINQFIWSGLNSYYLWVDGVPKLSPAYFQNNKDQWNAFLTPYSDHEKLFNDLLYQYGKVDKWSWIVDDYVALQNFFQGITKSMGYDYGLARIGTTDDILGFVQYVVKGSPADQSGIKRGDIFIKVNGEQLTVSNYQTLLVDSGTYTLSFANIVNHTVVPNGKELYLTATVVQENPIYYDTIFNINNNKIGYLVYNGFMSNYDIQLNQVFSGFKAAGINKLILDLRYNGGGSVQTAIYLASMIYGTYSNKVFIKSQYNDSLQSYLTQQYGSSFFSDNFTNVILQTTANPQTPINTLNLNDLYVLTTRNTASASELVINGLRPYMPVITIGDTTDGKYVGSMTIYDTDNYGNVNPNHKWALQPIVLKMANANGVSDFVDGLAPTVFAEEDIANLLPFGNPNETMLKATLDYINGVMQQSAVLKSKSMGFHKIADSKDFIPHAKEMYINKNINNKFRLKSSLH